MPKALAQFSITRTGEDYLLTIEDQDGETTEFMVDDDALDQIIDAIEDQLDEDEENGGGEDDEDESEDER
ncbi:hypothetical protein KRR38_08245 [Novosphingobium sp. G106]|uniref:hypothetical protein n=1 Tax=Novosphingobium sp. G106 TaxID=2849500 RepID=UPI001C2D3A4B|nr:hypothetical protein [Novosphingobium sp. G106]MBV1687666.1 hypothetical protein [Novosphingobium sp. G106]